MGKVQTGIKSRQRLELYALLLGSDPYNGRRRHNGQPAVPRSIYSDGLDFTLLPSMDLNGTTKRLDRYSSVNGRIIHPATQILAFNTDNDQFFSSSGNNYGGNSGNWSPNGSRGWFPSINSYTGHWPLTTTRPAIMGRNNRYSSLNGRIIYPATQILAFNTDNDQFFSGSTSYGSNSGNTGNWPQTTTRPAIVRSNNSNNHWGDFQSANLPPVSPTGSLPSTSHWVLPGNHPGSHYPNNGPKGNANIGQQMPGSSPGSSPSSSSFDNMYH